MEDRSWLEEQRDNLERRILEIEQETMFGEIDDSKSLGDLMVEHRKLMDERKACKEALARINKLLDQKE